MERPTPKELNEIKLKALSMPAPFRDYASLLLFEIDGLTKELSGISGKHDEEITWWKTHSQVQGKKLETLERDLALRQGEVEHLKKTSLTEDTKGRLKELLNALQQVLK